MPKHPAHQVCPLCGTDDDISWDVEGPGLWRFTCASHDTPYSWITTGADPISTAGHEGLSEQLGIYDSLLATFRPGDPYVEYGVVEHRYAHADPDAYRQLVATYGHTALAKGAGYTASAFVGAALGKLAREGLLVRVPCPATGYWSYNQTLHAYALPPGPQQPAIHTWAEHAAELGLAPTTWPTALTA